MSTRKEKQELLSNFNELTDEDRRFVRWVMHCLSEEAAMQSRGIVGKLLFTSQGAGTETQRLQAEASLRGAFERLGRCMDAPLDAIL